MNRDNNLWTVVASLQAFFRSLHVCIIGLEPCKTRSGVFRTSRLKIHKIQDDSKIVHKIWTRRYQEDTTTNNYEHSYSYSMIVKYKKEIFYKVQSLISRHNGH